MTARELILAAWNEFDQRIIDSAVKQWHTHLYRCDIRLFIIIVIYNDDDGEQPDCSFSHGALVSQSPRQQ